MAIHRFRLILMISAAVLICGCVSGLATGTTGLADVSNTPRAARELPAADSAPAPVTLVSPYERSVTVRSDDQGDDPVGHVIVYPLVILAAIVVIGATIGIISLVSGHH